MLLELWQDNMTNTWLLYSGRDSQTRTFVGYWPGSLFKALYYKASTVFVGGRVTYKKGGDLSPPLGSGVFASELYRKAAYVKNLQLFTDGTDACSLGDFSPLPYRQECYSISTPHDDCTAFIGGPGGCKD